MPAAPAADVRHATPFQCEGGAGLCALGNLKGFFAFERRNLDFSAECQRRILQRNLAEQIVAVALEEWMALHMYDDVEVASRPTCRPRLSLSAEPQTLSRGDPRWNSHGELFLFLHASSAAAGRAWFRDDLTRAAAGAAGPRNGEESLLIPKLPAAVALGTG